MAMATSSREIGRGQGPGQASGAGGAHGRRRGIPEDAMAHQGPSGSSASRRRRPPSIHELLWAQQLAGRGPLSVMAQRPARIPVDIDGLPRGCDAMGATLRSSLAAMTLSQILAGHHGCVNSLHWSADGRLLLSGSDDARLCVWAFVPGGSRPDLAAAADPPGVPVPPGCPSSSHSRLAATIRTGHTANIFSAVFMPHSGNRTAVSCSGDGHIRIFDVLWSSSSDPPASPSAPPPVTRPLHHLRCHDDRVKRIVTEPANPFLFWSCSEDGTVREFDLRSHSHMCSANTNGRPSASLSSSSTSAAANGSRCPPPLIDFGRAINALTINPSHPYELAIAGDHPHACLFDRRRTDRSVVRFKPTPEFASSTAHITGLAFSSSGRQLLGSWSNAPVFLFDETAEQKTSRIKLGKFTASTAPRSVGSTSFSSTSSSKPAVDKGKGKSHVKDTVKRKRSVSSLPIQQSTTTASFASASDNASPTKFSRTQPQNTTGEINDTEGMSDDTVASASGDVASTHATVSTSDDVDHDQVDSQHYIQDDDEEEEEDDDEEYPDLPAGESDDDDGNGSSENGHGTHTYTYGSTPMSTKPHTPLKLFDSPVLEPKTMYRGHCNVQTVKDVFFVGDINGSDDYVASGSDDGSVYIWNKRTSKIVQILYGDTTVVNVVQQHPWLPVLGVSGIDSTIKIFEPLRGFGYCGGGDVVTPEGGDRWWDKVDREFDSNAFVDDLNRRRLGERRNVRRGRHGADTDASVLRTPALADDAAAGPGEASTSVDVISNVSTETQPIRRGATNGSSHQDGEPESINGARQNENAYQLDDDNETVSDDDDDDEGDDDTNEYPDMGSLRAFNPRLDLAFPSTLSVPIPSLSPPGSTALDPYTYGLLEPSSLMRHAVSVITENETRRRRGTLHRVLTRRTFLALVQRGMTTENCQVQ